MTVLAVEVVALLAMGAVGWVLVGPARGAVWQLGAALPVGIAATTLVELVLLAARVPARPWVALVVAVVAAAALAVARRDRSVPGAAVASTGGVSSVQAAALGVGVLLAVAAITAWLPLVNLTADSFRFVPSSHLLSVDGNFSGVSLFLLTTRGLVLPTVHGLAVTEFGYLRALGPLLGLATLGLLGLLVRDGTRRLSGGFPTALAFGAVALLATSSRFVFSTFYLNAHVLFACWLLLLVAMVRWLLLDPSAATGRRDAWLVGLLAAGLALLRAEGALVAALALAPLVVDRTIPVAHRRIALVVPGVAIPVWQLGVVLRQAASITQDVSVPGLAALGVGMVVVAALLPVVERIPRPLWLLHGLVWLGTVGLAVGDLGLARDSIEATVTNVTGEGLWGGSLLLLAAFVVAGVALRQVDAERALVFPLVTFVPLGLLLSLLRGHSYRVGPGDSLNRMLLHLVPAAILLLALSAAGRWRRDRDAARPAEWTAAG